MESLERGEVTHGMEVVRDTVDGQTTGDEEGEEEDEEDHVAPDEPLLVDTELCVPMTACHNRMMLYERTTRALN